MTSHSSRLLALDRQGKARKRKRRPRRKSLMLGTKTSVLVATSRLLNQPGVAEVDASPDRTSRDPPRESLAAGGKQQPGGSAADRSLRYSGAPGAAQVVELVALAGVTGVGLLILDRRARVDPTPRDASAHAIASIIDAIAPNAITSILLLVAGLLLVFGVHAGLDVLVLPVLVALAGGVTSAWLLLTKIPE